MFKYEVIMYWSNEDEAFVAEVPELPGCNAHGATQSKALISINQAMKLWLRAAREDMRAIPEPRGTRLMFA